MQVMQDTFFDRRVYLIVGLLGTAGLFAAGYFGYMWYKGSVEQAAYKDLAAFIDEYRKVQRLKDPAAKLSDVERAFGLGAERHSSASLYPYFLAYEADVLLQEGKIKEAVELMDKALAKMDRSQQIYYLYAIKRALMKIDAADSAMSKEGTEALEALAQDRANPLQDMALYYSALHAGYRADKDAALKQFQQIIARGKVDSHWHQMALAKVSL